MEKAAKCIYCDEGFDLPYPLTMHPECAIRCVMDSAVHIERVAAGLPCDPAICHAEEEGLTKRQAARLANFAWHELQVTIALNTSPLRVWMQHNSWN